MRKRLLVIGLSVVGILGIQGSAMAHEESESESERRDWACIAIHDLDQGVCQRNPLPDRLPLPEDTTAPAVTAPEAPTVTVPDAPSAPSVPLGL